MFRYSPEGALRGIYARAESMPPTVLHGGRIFDGQTWLSDLELEIAGGVITRIGDRLERAPDAHTIDLSGQWLMPGLVDCRAYPVGQPPDEIARPQASRFRTSGPILAHRGVADAHRMLSGGITAVAQLGGGDVEYVAGLREAVRTGLIAGPSIINAGRPLSPIGGGVEAWHEPAPNELARLPGSGMLRRPSRHTALVAGTPDGLRKAIRRNFVDGADMLMLLLTSDLPSEQVALSDAELAAATHEAQRVGARVACLANGNRPALAAVRAGVDLLILGPGEPDEELVRALGEGQTAWAPGLAGRRDGSGRRLQAAVKAVHQRGGRLVVGTGWRREAPVAFAAEVEALVAAGLPTAAALASASSVGAQVLGLASGRLAAGERANLVAFDRDPLADPSVLGESGSARRIVHASPARRLTPLQSILGVRTAS